MSTELWKAIFDWGTVVLIGLTFAFGAGALITGNKLSERQDEQSKQFEKDLTDAKTALGAQQERAAIAEKSLKEVDAKTEGFRLAIAQANERAAKAQGSLATAEQHAAEANAKAEGFRLDIAKANERAASANEIAERERLARLQLEARLADRIITPDQKRRITEAFAPMKGQTMDVVIPGDTPETSRVAEAIIGCLSDAGVLLNVFHPFSGGGAQGVVIGVRPDATEGDKRAGTQLFAILRETLGGGVGLVDFDKIVVGGTGNGGSTPGAAPSGKSPIRLQIAPK